MDNYDLKPEPKARRNPLILDLLTVLVLLGICGLVYLFWTIATSPYDKRNWFHFLQPTPSPTLYQTPTPTITIIPLEPTWTFTSTIQPSPSRTKAPTWTPLPEMITPTDTQTPTETPIVDTPTITSTPMPASAEITYAASTTIHPTSACAWMGVGGKVVDSAGTALQFQTIQLGGTLSDKTVNRTMLSGSAPAYGASGFEFVLGNQPVDTTQVLWIQLFDNAGKPLTDKIYFDTFSDCSKNLVLVVFTKNP